MKEQKNVEQSEEVNQTDNQECVQNLGPMELVEDSTEQYGNFVNAEELHKAYKNLHAEFTRKSQELKRLETLNESHESTKADTTPASIANNENVETIQVESMPPTPKSTDDIIREYLFGVKQRKVPPVIMGSTNNMTSSSGGIRNLRDAEKLARDFFNSKSN